MGGAPRTPDPLNAALGNRTWRIPRPGGGDAILKLHRRRRSLPKSVTRWMVTALARLKTLPDAASRRATEERLLRAWGAAGCDVPAVLDPATEGLAPGPALLMEAVGDGTLLDRLRPGAALAGEQRAALLRRFGAAWAHRHRVALQRDDASFVLEHGTLAHVLVDDERLAFFDLEQAWLPGCSVLPLLAKELAACLRSLAKIEDEQRFRADLVPLADGYADDAQLGALIDEGLASRSALQRLVQRVDGRRGARRGFRYDKAALLGALREALQR
ncbi:MAG: hypothetical protein DRQ55_15415 [Planctomycetota bacterium]|nr:MAG: hypothetical protein DRQ55_15415 [Planctomycetota bacterium]